MTYNHCYPKAATSKARYGKIIAIDNNNIFVNGETIAIHRAIYARNNNTLPTFPTSSYYGNFIINGGLRYDENDKKYYPLGDINILQADYETLHSEGVQTYATIGGHSEGYKTYALSYNSHVEGEGTVALGYGSHAEGAATKAIGHQSHSEGELTQAIGYSSHAEGEGTISEGTHSHAEG